MGDATVPSNDVKDGVACDVKKYYGETIWDKDMKYKVSDVCETKCDRKPADHMRKIRDLIHQDIKDRYAILN